MSPGDAALLVVDDNEGNRYTLTRRLRREGYINLVTASDGRQALAMLREQRFDLMLLDIMMPEMDGYQVLEYMKSDPALRDIPVIMISALEEVESVIRCVELGAEDYLPKPFNPTLLRARVGTSLEKKRLRDEVRASLRRLEQELDTARALQFGMLPSTFPVWSQERPVHVHAAMETAREVGGDLYDFFYASEHTFCFLIGDVSGKGAPAAMFMARTRSLVRLAATLWYRLAASSASPSQIAAAVNDELCKDNRERMFVTLFLGFLDTRTGTLKYVNAGHPKPYVLRGSDIGRAEGKPDVPLGVRQHASYQERAMVLMPCDALFLYTDGIVEAMNGADEIFSEARLSEQLHVTSGATPADMLRRVRDAVDTFSGNVPRADDLTMLALRWDPRAEAQATESTLRPSSSVAVHSGDCVAADGRSIDVVIRNDMAELSRLSAALDRFGRENAVAEKTLVELQIVLDEMVSNVIKYAWPEGGEHAVHVRFAVSGEQISLEISDDGRMFNPLQAVGPARPLPGTRPRPGHLGIHMVKRLVDSIEFERVGERNRVTLIKRCPQGAAPQ